MLARLQRAMVAATVVGALAWAAWSRQAGLGGGAMVVGMVLALVPQLPLLAIEFALLAAFGRDPDVPRAGVIALLRAWAAEVLASWRVFNWRQPFFADREPDVPGRPGQTGVLLVHGYFCNRGLWAPWMRRFRERGLPCMAPSFAPAFGRVEDWVPAIEAAVTALTRSTGRPPLVVAHSMGGLAVRAWLASQRDADAADARVLHVLTIATPHQGTWMARFGYTPNARQMRPGHRWLTALAAAERPARRARFTCYFSQGDNIVFPAGLARLAGADNRHLAAVAHVAMVQHAAVFDETLRRLAAANGA